MCEIFKNNFGVLWELLCKILIQKYPPENIQKYSQKFIENAETAAAGNQSNTQQNSVKSGGISQPGDARGGKTPSSGGAATQYFPF